MGSNADDALAECQKYRSDCSRGWFTHEEPPHTVMLDAFWIDETEVTNKMYSLCVAADICREPSNISSDTHSSYYGNSEFDNYPVIYVDWNMSKTYCEWVGRRLPTEAEWEKAASWNDLTQEKYVFPWGYDFNGSIVNSCDKRCTLDWADKNSDDGYADTSPVGNYPDGVSSYYVYDMAGNVWEWVSSLYKPYPYDANDGREDMNSSDVRLFRGGSWSYYDYVVRSAHRLRSDPSNSFSSVGFRCARSLP